MSPRNTFGERYFSSSKSHFPALSEADEVFVSMSNINQSLNILLPTRNNDFSRELLDLSQSLLAQSRIRAPNLKAEEEIARAYACSEIACEKYAHANGPLKSRKGKLIYLKIIHKATVTALDREATMCA